MDNNNESMLDVYLFESNDLLEHLDEILLASEKNKSLSMDDINEVFRIMHTIKGSSAMMEFNSLMEIAHKMEDLFAYVRDNGIPQESLEDLFDLVFKSEDFLKAELDKVQQGEPLTTDIGTLAGEINGFLKKISEGKSTAKPEDSKGQGEQKSGPPASSEEGTLLRDEAKKGFSYPVRVFFDEEAQMENLRAFMLVNNLQDSGQSFEFYPKDIETNSETEKAIMKDGFYLFFSKKEERDRAVPTIEHFTYTKDYTLLSHTEPEPKAPTVGGKAALANNKKAAVTKIRPAVKQSLINVNLSKLDSLMDLMGEIVITESMVTSNPALQSAGLDNNFTKASRQLRKLTDELQEIVMSIRMVPISTVFQKMNRVVRDMSKNLHKDAQLVLVGEETEVDKTIVDSIADPIMHLVRNSMTTGLKQKKKGRKPTNRRSEP